MISLKCHSCDASYQVKDQNAGRKFRCKSCDTIVTIPDRTRQSSSKQSSSKQTSSAEPQRRNSTKHRRPSRSDDYESDEYEDYEDGDANDGYEDYDDDGYEDYDDDGYEDDYEDDYEDRPRTRQPRRGTGAPRSSRTRRRGKPASFFQRIRQAVPRTRSDGTWTGNYAADPLIWAGVPCGVFFLTILMLLFLGLAGKFVGGALLAKLSFLFFGIVILGAVITFGMAMVSGIGMLIQLSGDPNISGAKLFFVPGYQVYCVFKYWKRYRKLFIFQCSVLLTWPAFGLGYLFSFLFAILGF